jgi:putative transposase
MKTGNKLRRGSHCVFLMHVHLVFVTKYLRNVFTAQVLHDLRNIFTSVCSDFESQLMEFDGEDDPVHLLVNYPPKITVAALVNSLKGVSSRLLRLKNHPASEACYGASRCGRRAPSPEVAVAHPSPLSDNTLSSNARLIERAGNALGVRVSFPLKDGACRVSGSRSADDLI